MTSLMLKRAKIRPENDDDSDILQYSYSQKRSRKSKKKGPPEGNNMLSAVKDSASRFTKQRNELKEKVLKEVMENAFPDMQEFAGDEFVVGKFVPDEPPWYIRIFQLLGFMNVSIHEAIANGSTYQLSHTLKELTEKVDKEKIEPGFVNQVNELGHTPLAEAVRSRRLDMVELLLMYHAEIDVVDDETGMTPLLYSVTLGTLNITATLLQNRADVNLSDFNGTTALMYAASLGDLDHCHLLIRYNANLDFVDQNGWSALHYAAFGGSPNVCAYLLDEGINRDIKDNNNRKAIHVAKFRNNGEAEALLEVAKRKLI